jgi:DNA-binding NtrC family response regulator
MRVDLQAKLLRAIQEREVQRLGSTRTRKVDVRILAATGEDLERAIGERRFREDLYYRLNVVPVVLPPLRDRAEDIPLLVDHFVAASAKKLGRDPLRISPDTLEHLQRYAWPGNVRELENCVERLVVLARGPRITPEDLPAKLRQGAEANGGGNGFELPVDGVCLAELERNLIEQALKRSRGSFGHAARLLGISYKPLQYRVRKYELNSPRDLEPEG